METEAIQTDHGQRRPVSHQQPWPCSDSGEISDSTVLYMSHDALARSRATKRRNSDSLCSHPHLPFLLANAFAFRAECFSHFSCRRSNRSRTLALGLFLYCNGGIYHTCSSLGCPVIANNVFVLFCYNGLIWTFPIERSIYLFFPIHVPRGQREVDTSKYILDAFFA